MGNETRDQAIQESSKLEEPKKDYTVPASILISATILAGAWVYTTRLKTANIPQKTENTALEEKVLPREGIILPIRWNDLGTKLASVEVINLEKLELLYAERGGLTENEQKLLYSTDNGNLTITAENSGFLLNLFWALGLGTKNEILDNGPMNEPRYGGAGNFASTGGWTLSDGDAMNHYSRHPFIILTPEQQKPVEQVSKNIYRPCCNNPTHFPDCNHGMAMLGLLELLASQGISEKEIYTIALQVNAYWFPDTYLIIAQYLASNGRDWETADPKELLGANYSSNSGYRQILNQVATPINKGNGGCGV